MFSTAYINPYISAAHSLAMADQFQQPHTPTRSTSRTPQPRLHPSVSMPNLWHPAAASGRGTPATQQQQAQTFSLDPEGAFGPLGISIPQAQAVRGREGERRDSGSPLTPPMTPSSRGSLQQQLEQQQKQTEVDSPASPARFDPFSSYSFYSQAPRLGPASPTSPARGRSGTPGGGGQVQFPRTEEEGVGGGTRRGDVIEIEGGQRGGRLLLAGHVPVDANASTLTQAFGVLGDLKGIFVRFQAEHGVVVLSFYDMRQAARAHLQIRTMRFFKEGLALQSRFISPAELRKYTGQSSFVDDAEGEVYISTMGDGTLNQLALQNALAYHGGLRQFRVVGAHGKAFFAEFFDTRDASAAVSDLHDRVLMGVHLRLTHRHPPQPLLVSSQAYNGSMLTISDLQRRHDELALFAHFHELVARKQKEEELATLGSCKTPDGSDIARGGPYDGREGTLGRRGSFPGSSPRIDEKEERYAALQHTEVFVDEGNQQQHAQQQQQQHFYEGGEFERGRKSSNIYGPDHSKAVIPSYPSPRTPSRSNPNSSPTQYQQQVQTPKRKISLPPYTGPLPPPATQGGPLSWPLPLPLRIPTPPPSGGTASSSTGSSGTDSPEFFIPTQTPPRRQGRQMLSGAGASAGGQGGAQAAHAFLPASARAVLDLLREPPPERNRIDIARIEQGLDTRTTVMLKNVPNKMTDRHLMSFIDTVCPRSYTFLYLRMDFENHCNVGYAFVNFIDVASLLRFAKAKLGQKWGMFNSEKVLHMSYANYQGKEALIEKFRNSGVMEEREAWRPKIFYSSGPMQGLPEPFPPANNHLRQQRSFQNGRAQGLYNNTSSLHSPLSP